MLNTAKTFREAFIGGGEKKTTNDCLSEQRKGQSTCLETPAKSGEIVINVLRYGKTKIRCHPLRFAVGFSSFSHLQNHAALHAANQAIQSFLL